MSRLAGIGYYGLPLLILIAGIVLVVREPRLVEGLRLTVFDTYQRVQPRDYTPMPVTIIDIDEESLAKLGQWPWPRTLLAVMAERLRDAGVGVMGMDFIFAEPDRTSPRQVLPGWPDSPVVSALRGEIESLPDHDLLFAETLTQVQAVGGFVFTPSGSEAAPAPRWTVDMKGGDARPFLPTYDGVVGYLPELDAALAGAGSFNLISDRDGLTRRLHLFYVHDGKPYPSFAAELLRAAQFAEGYEIQMAEGQGTGIESISIGAFTVPTDRNGRVWMHYTRPQPERYLSAWKLFDPEFDATALAGHIAVLGTSAAGLKDLRATPMERAAPGVSLHTALVEQVLLDEFLYRPGWAEAVEYSYTLLLALVLLFLLRRLNAIGCAAVGALAVLLAAGFSWYCYTELQFLVDPVLPSLAALAVYLTATTVNYLRTEAERRQVRHAFGHYLAPALVEQLTSNPGMLKLGGEKRETTFLFTDLAGFTSLTEKLEPALLVHILNHYLDETCSIVLKHGGTIDKIVGDALHVMFNAPTEQPDHPARAVRCAVELDTFCQRFVAEQREQGLKVGITRMGVNTGSTVVGNFGGAARFDYTAHGDAINTAARLESVNKHLGTRLCVSGTTREHCGDDIAFRPVADLVLKGKSEALSVFEPLTGQYADDNLKAYGEAFALLRDGDGAAGDAFQALAERFPDDPLALFHARRLADGESGVRIVMEDK